jgi:hypothetical protein
MTYNAHTKGERELFRDTLDVSQDLPAQRVTFASDANARIEQERNGQDNLRVFDPSTHQLLQEMLIELKRLNSQLQIITEEEINNGNY